MPNVIYANDFAAKDSILRLHCISHKTLPNAKSDAFVFEYCGELWLIDGGLPKATYVAAYLLNLRRAYLKDYPHLIDDPSCKLRLNWIISHFHGDHVGAGLEKLLPNPYFEFVDIYCPPDSAVAPEYQVLDKDGDEKLRPQFEKEMAAVGHPASLVHDIAFGKENRFTVSSQSGTGKEVYFTFLPPVRDLGEKWYMEYIFDFYKSGGEGIGRMPVSAVNNSSVWVLAEYGGKKILFTGDTMKREKCLHSEGLEYMMSAYAAEIGKLDVLKFVHHGFARNHALPAMMSFEPEILLVAKTDSTIPPLKEKHYPDAKTEILNVADRSLLITCGYDSDGNELPLSYAWLEEEPEVSQ